MAEIRQLRLSFIWMEAFPLERTAASLLGDSQRYRLEYDRAKSGKGSWSLPWVSKKRQRFWEYYLEKWDKESLEANKCWKHLMPLRSPPFVKVTKTPDLRLVLEGFGYPHGVAVLATVYIKQDLPLFEMVDKAIDIWRGRHSATWPETGATAKQSLEGLARQGLEFLSGSLGEEPKTLGEHLRRLFTVATVINARGFEKQECQSGGEIHRALEGLCSLDPSYKQNPLPDLAECRLRLHPDSPSMHLLYHRERSRALWFPHYYEELFEGYLSENKTIRTLGCFHRNLTLAALQVESLIALIMPLSKLLRQNQEIPVPLRTLARYAGGITGRLHGGKSTYRTLSVRVRLEEKRIFEALDLVRRATGIPD